MNGFFNIITLLHIWLNCAFEWTFISEDNYHAHFKEPKILDRTAILEEATIFILSFIVLLFSIRLSSVSISNIRSVSNKFNAGIRLNVRWHSQHVALIPSAHEVHLIIFSSNTWHSFLQNAYNRSLNMYLEISFLVIVCIYCT